MFSDGKAETNGIDIRCFLRGDRKEIRVGSDRLIPRTRQNRPEIRRFNQTDGSRQSIGFQDRRSHGSDPP